MPASTCNLLRLVAERFGVTFERVLDVDPYRGISRGLYSAAEIARRVERDAADAKRAALARPDVTDEERAAVAVVRGLARAKLDRARKAEPVITKALRAAVKADKGRLDRLDNLIKTEDSVYRKITTLIFKFEIKPSHAWTLVYDALRYTVVLPDKGYWAAGTRIIKAIEAMGYEHIPRKRNTGWRSGRHKTRNETFRTADGTTFEVQFHTEASREADDKTRDWYEEYRLPTTPPWRRAELDALIADTNAAVPIPDDVPPN